MHPSNKPSYRVLPKISFYMSLPQPPGDEVGHLIEQSVFLDTRVGTIYNKNFYSINLDIERLTRPLFAEILHRYLMKWLERSQKTDTHLEYTNQINTLRHTIRS